MVMGVFSAIFDMLKFWVPRLWLFEKIFEILISGDTDRLCTVSVMLFPT